MGITISFRHISPDDEIKRYVEEKNRETAKIY